MSMKLLGMSVLLGIALGSIRILWVERRWRRFVFLHRHTWAIVPWCLVYQLVRFGKLPTRSRVRTVRKLRTLVEEGVV